jgi:ATP/maltotriose-dependent transcriptional regulator MalT
VLILARSLPPAPLWRLRSKQSLDVIEEGALAFTPAEAEELFASYGLSAAEAGQAWEQSHGRAVTLDALAQRAPLPLLESPLHALGW